MKPIKPIKINKEHFNHMLKGYKVEFVTRLENGETIPVKIELSLDVILEVLKTQLELEKTTNIKNYYRDLIKSGLNY